MSRQGLTCSVQHLPNMSSKPLCWEELSVEEVAPVAQERNLGIMENIMQTTIVYWGYIGIMENKMESTIVYWGYLGIVPSDAFGAPRKGV